MKQIKITDEIYGHDFTFLYECSEQESIDHIRLTCDLEKEKQGNDATYFVLKTLKDDDVFERFIVVNQKVTKFSVVVHEIFHYVHEVMNHIGLKLNDETEEAYAYFLEYIYKKILKAIEEQRNESISKG
ncbi:MAG: hypothetical protein WC648_04140 [Candidatus Paceibacterota bacterium]|jgi:predicted transcriptional regulator